MDRNFSNIKLDNGVFNHSRTKYSDKTKDLIKTLMEEAKVTMMHRKNVLKILEDGLPLLMSKDQSKRSVSDRKKKTKSEPAIPGTRKKRSQDMIIRSGAYEREQYRRMTPLMGQETQKRRLAYLMAYGKDMPPTPREKPHYLKVIKETRNEQDYDPIEDLVRGIEERMKFLDDMESLGEGKKYRPIIQQEVAQKIRLIEALDGGDSPEIKKEIEKYKAERPVPKPFPLGELDDE